MAHIEMIIDYVIDGDDFQYNDNHGVLIRCKDCRYKDLDMKIKDGGVKVGCCPIRHHVPGMTDEDYCSFAEKKYGK